MDLIVRNSEGEEIGFAKGFHADFDVGDTNDFELEMPKTEDCGVGYMVAEPNTEYGGILSKIITETDAQNVIYGGLTFRGMLSKKIIRPLKEGTDDYRIVSGNVGGIIVTFLTEFQLTDLFEAESTDVTITSFQFDRYCTFLDGITKMLKSIGQKIVLKYEEATGKVKISVEAIHDWTEDIEMSDDCGLKVKLTRDEGCPNHLIVLGKGELHERKVVDLYMDAKGNVSTSQTFFGVAEVVETYEMTSEEDEASLISEGTEKLQSYERKKFEFTVDDMTEVELLDIVGARDYATGEYFTTYVSQKIVRGNETQKTIEYKVGE